MASSVIVSSSSLSLNVAVEEDDWNLPTDFDLFASYKAHPVYFSPAAAAAAERRRQQQGLHQQSDDEDKEKNSNCFYIECVEDSFMTPLDVTTSLSSKGEHDATGHCVWMGAIFFVQSLSKSTPSSSSSSRSLFRQAFQNRRVMELGTGTGIGGLALLTAPTHFEINPKHVCLTDGDPAVLELCQRNCELNHLLPDSTLEDSSSSSSSVFSIQQLMWECDDDIEEKSRHKRKKVASYDTVLALDVLYDIGILPALFQTARRWSNQFFVLGHVPRACYSDDHPPVENLGQYIVEQAHVQAGFVLRDAIRPSSSDSMNTMEERRYEANATATDNVKPKSKVLDTNDALNATSMEEMQQVGAVIFIFEKC